MTSFQVLHEKASAAELLARAGTAPGERRCVVCEVTDRALVLGSAQSVSEADETYCSGAGVAVLQRRSGGGAVFVAPGGQAWVDVFLPAGDPLWQADVGRSFLWLGEAWAAALEALGAPGGRPGVAAPGGASSPWSRRLCFGATGPGEVLVGGRKAVGISQRRSRLGSWLFSMAPVADHSEELVGALALTAPERRAALARLAESATYLPFSPHDLAEALVSKLP